MQPSPPNFHRKGSCRSASFDARVVSHLVCGSPRLREFAADIRSRGFGSARRSISRADVVRKRRIAGHAAVSHAM